MLKKLKKKYQKQLNKFHDFYFGIETKTKTKTKLGRRRKMITKVWYSVENGGDGSAYPKFVDSEELAELLQEQQSEGWGESCTGYLEIESEGPIKVKDMRTLDDTIKDASEDIDESWWDEYDQEKLDELLKLKENLSK